MPDLVIFWKVGEFPLHRFHREGPLLAMRVVERINAVVNTHTPRDFNLTDDVAEFEIRKTAGGEDLPSIRLPSGEEYFVQIIFSVPNSYGTQTVIYGETDENGEFIQDRNSWVFLLGGVMWLKN